MIPPVKVWASRRSIRESIADVPENWLDRFAIAQPEDLRKFGTARNATLLYRTAAILEAVEQGLYFDAIPIMKEPVKTEASDGLQVREG